MASVSEGSALECFLAMANIWPAVATRSHTKREERNERSTHLPLGDNSALAEHTLHLADWYGCVFVQITYQHVCVKSGQHPQGSRLITLNITTQTPL